jgi:transposase
MLKRRGLKAFVKQKKSFLIPAHRSQRLKFAKKYKH